MANLSIENIDIPSIDQWDRIWRQCDYATYFHSPQWAQIWGAYTNGKTSPDPKIIKFSDGKIALLPLSKQVSLKLLKSHISSPAGNLGGWITTDKLESSHANLIINYLKNEYSNLLLYLNPFDDLVALINTRSNFSDQTYASYLSAGLETAFKKWRSEQRRKVKQAKGAGVTIRLANSAKDWNTYYEIYKDSLRRWGKNATTDYKEGLFQELFKRQSPNIKLWLAIFEDKIIAGNIALYSKKHVAGWHAAALQKYFKTRMVNLIIYSILKDACENGYRWLDYGACGGHESVRSFKKEFGTTELSFPIIKIETGSKKILNEIHERVK